MRSAFIALPNARGYGHRIRYCRYFRFVPLACLCRFFGRLRALRDYESPIVPVMFHPRPVVPVSHFRGQARDCFSYCLAQEGEPHGVILDFSRMEPVDELEALE